MRLSKKFIVASACALVLATTLPASQGRAGDELPAFTDVGRQIEASLIEGARVIYWDQSGADALGIKTAPGRVGVKEFEDSIIEQMAYEIAKTPDIKPISGWAGLKERVKGWVSGPKKRPPVVLEIELDHFGGSGRAGYVRLNGANDKTTWVNIKGIGITGMGTTKKLQAGPPGKMYSGHRDGSARMSEGISEVVSAMIASNELKFGASRVVGLITTNRVIEFEDGWKSPLVLIVRAPLRRMDRDKGESTMRPELTRIAESLGQANASRIFKGDFVNTSNMGYDGSVIDFGLFNVPNGYVPITTHEDSRMFFETKNLFRLRPDIRATYERTIAFYLLNQMGLEEPRLQALRDEDPRGMDRKLAALASAFLQLVKTENDGVKLDGATHEEIDGNLKLQRVFRSALPEILLAPSESAALNKLVELGRQNIDKPSATFDTNYRRFAQGVVGLVRNAASDKLGNATYAEEMRKIAEFKNRDLWAVWKHDLFNWAVGKSDAFLESGDAWAVQTAIDDLVNENHWHTGDYTSSQMAIHSDNTATYINLKARQTANGEHGLFSYPELTLTGKNEAASFWISLDGARTTQKVDAALIQTEMGPYYQIKLAHGHYPVTTELVRIWPEARLANGKSVEIKGPPLLINQRLGLQADLEKAPSLMRETYDIKLDLRSEDFKPHAAVVRSCRDTAKE